MSRENSEQYINLDQMTETCEPAKLARHSAPHQDLAYMQDAVKTAQADYARVAGKLAESEAELLRLSRLWHTSEVNLSRMNTEAVRNQQIIDADLIEIDSLLNEIIGIPDSDVSAVGLKNLVDKVKLLQDHLKNSEKLNNTPETTIVNTAENDLRVQIDQRFKEIATLTRMLKMNKHEIDQSLKNRQWALSIASNLLKIPRWWALLPKRQYAEHLHARLARLNLFDSSAYLARHPDVDASGMDPLEHYILHGLVEGRARD